MYQIGLSACGAPVDEKFLRGCQKSGISVVELSEVYEQKVLPDYVKLGKLAKECGITLTFHFPFHPFERLDISNPELADYSVEYYTAMMERVMAAGVTHFVLHPSGEPIEEEDRSRRMECAKKSLAKLAENAQQRGAVILVEDLPRTCLGRNSADMEELVSAHEALRICFDTNHLLNENIVDFIHRVGKRFAHTHVSDYDFMNERHWLPGEGKLDWQAILKALEEVGYQGPWLYEISLPAPYSIRRERDLVFDDFVRNANELFENKTPTTFSTHFKKLGMWEVEEE